MKARVSVMAGVCGFSTTIVAESEDGQNVSFVVESECENIDKLAQNLGVVDAYSEVGSGFEGRIHGTVRQSLRGCCSGCVVPCGIFKAMQVAAGLALPAPASIDIVKE